MKDSELTKLLKATAKAAYKHRQLVDKLNEACEEMYGESYSDIDADGLIDTLDQIGSNDGKSDGKNINSRWFHQQMQDRGARRIDKDTDEYDD